AGEGDGKAEIYGAHFGPLSALVSSKGRRAGVWGDMFLTHPTALDYMPKDTLIFDWQYFSGVSETAAVFTAKGFEVVGCPTIQTYNAIWCHVEETEKNVRDVRDDVVADGLFGVCVTTWECGLMGSFDTLFPMLKACGGLLNGSEVSLLDGYEPGEREWVRLMGIELKSAGGSFAAGRIRSSLKVRLLLNANPFLAWMHHAAEFEGEVGDRALAVIADAFFAAPGEAEKGICLFARSGIEFVRLAEAARVLYAAGQPEAAIAKLGVTRKLFDDLGVVAKRTYERIGGSLADVERCRIAREHVETVIKRIRQYGNGSLGYLPAFEILTHPKFCPHDQASWWLINKWANQ
ncbi:MAG: hypothetical protein K8R88_08935, partial [Armatimonadetes bacterium]|nr:hypothetical protein [Armatimonadota bacterium]